MHHYNAKQHNVPSDRAYAAKIIRGLLNNERPEDIDWAHLNGHGDLVEGLVDIFDEFGAEGTRESWETESPDYPELLPYMKPLMHISELKHLPQPSWLVEPFLPEGEVVLVYGPPASGKSFWVLDLAMQVVKHAPVVYVAAEGVRGYRNRTAAWSKHHNEAIDALPVFFEDDPPQLMDEDSVEIFVERILPLNPKLVVIDTVAQCFIGGDENSSAQMSLFIAGCQKIQRATGATVLLVHHSTKSAAETERGSSALKGAVQTSINLVAAKDGTITVSCKKMKDDVAFADLKYELLQVSLDDDQVSCIILPKKVSANATADKDDPEAEPTLNANQATVLKLVAQAGDKGIRRCDVMRGAELTDNGTTAVLKQLLGLEFISREVTGKPYVITEAGQTFLEQVNNPTD